MVGGSSSVNSDFLRSRPFAGFAGSAGCDCDSRASCAIAFCQWHDIGYCVEFEAERTTALVDMSHQSLLDGGERGRGAVLSNSHGTM